jgi:hypothetical protein
MFKQRVTFLILFVVVLFGLGLLLGLFMPRLAGFTGAPKNYNTATVLEQVKTLSELVTVQYVLEKVIVLEDVKWYGENRVLLVAHAIVKAGTDLARLELGDLQVAGKKITVKFPPPQITDAYLDDKQTQVIERTTGLLRVFDKNLEQTARQTAIDDIRRAARNSGILKDAENRAREQLTSLCRRLGFEEVEFRPR